VSTVHAAVHLQIDEAKTIAELVGRVDRHLQKYAATRKFLTCFFGLVEPDTGTLRYVSAGHNPALLRKSSGAVEQIKATGVPIGMFPNASWREESVVMERGDLLCVYSDGITESLDAAGVSAALDEATLLCLPSRAEGLGRVVVEAMCRGRAVVGGDAGGIPDLVGDGVDGLLVRPGEPASLADALIRILGDRELAVRLGAAARLRGEELTPAPAEYAARVAAVVGAALP